MPATSLTRMEGQATAGSVARILLPPGIYVPHELNGWVRLHPRVVYRLLFHSVWQTLQKFARNPKRLNGELGATMVLHTWGQKLDQHVHLHVLVPAGAWNKQTKQWHPADSTYLFPVKALSAGFKGRMVSALRHGYEQDDMPNITRNGEVNRILEESMNKDWVVYTKACHGKPERVLDYLSRYTYRIAISESRLIDTVDDGVRFRWKDYRDGQHKVMRLSGVEFIRRFLQHVLPKGFMRIRHYGFLSNRYRRVKLAEINEVLRHSKVYENKTTPDEISSFVESPLDPKLLWFCCHCNLFHLRNMPWRRMFLESLAFFRI